MIVICEPHVKGVEHEKVNSGFIYGLSLAYPHEAIRFYGEYAHIEAIKEILIHDKILINKIEYVPIKIRDFYSIIGVFTFYRLFNKILSDVLDTGTNKIFFLSFSPMILYVIKKLKQKSKFSTMKFTLVLHGELEDIANDDNKMTGLSLPIKKLSNEYIFKYVFQKIRQMKFRDLLCRGAEVISTLINKPRKSISKKLFKEREMLLWKHSADFKYICLSPHIIANAERYINTKELNMYTVVLPTIFAEPIPVPHNEYVKFATFGYGNALILRNVLFLLSQKELKKFYEIRVIGMDYRGIEGFPNTSCPSIGKMLDRSDMEKYASDIDMFLILRTYSTNYRLSCSNSILESLSYIKPILHFNNDCINTFNKHENPIGFCCNSLEEFVSKMEDIIENYEIYKFEFQTFRKNILKLRNEYAIENSLTQLRNSFTWED